MSRITVQEKAGYLADSIFAASDGVVTTFAVVAGSAGASLGSNVVLILGFSNLFADGFSMAIGNYLGVKSEIDYEEVRGKDGKYEGSPVRHGFVTFLSFNLFGLIPLLPFVFSLESSFKVSVILVGITLFIVGFLRSFFTKKGRLRSGIEMFAIGGFAAFVAFFVGYAIEHYILAKGSL